MKNHLIAGMACLLAASGSFAQVEYKDVASIFYARCTSCHHTGAHDRPFMNYAQTSVMAPLIQVQLNAGTMPPWSADTSYTRFQHERIITAPEKQKILDWISGGAAKGDTTLAPAPPVYSSQYQLSGDADLTLSIGSFTSTSGFTDKYYCFAIPTGLVEDRIIRAFELVPGNKSIVHHAVITADTTGNYSSDLSGSCYNIPGNLGIGTFAPGTRATIFPSQAPLKAGIYLKAGSTIVIQLHYPAGSSGEVDSTMIRLYFYPPNSTGVRRIYSSTPLQNWQMAITANSVVPVSAYYPSPNFGLPLAMSAYGVMPHSHLLCDSIINYAYNPGFDTIPLVRINHWDFEWQDYYTFKKLVKVPAGYRLYSKHVFDNTANNPHNPNDPPVTVYAGTDTDDEMLFDGMLYLVYQPGDELIDVESIIRQDPLLGLNENKASQPTIRDCMVFPNPFTNYFNLRYTLTETANVSLTFSDISGREIGVFDLGKQAAGSHEWQWDTKKGSSEILPPGVYFYEVTVNNFTYRNKILKGN